MNLIDKIELIIKECLSSLGYNEEVKIEVCSRSDLADYQYNGVFALAKKYQIEPAELAKKIASLLNNNNIFKSVNSIGGFINLKISNLALASYLNEIIVNPEINIYKIEQEKFVLFDYGGANVAKELHVGHLRSPNIGEALKRLYQFIGYKTISDVHLGDWGRPMGLIIKEIKERMPDLIYFDEEYEGKYPLECPVTLEELNNIYPASSLKAKNDEAYLNEAREITTKLQNGHKGYLALWKSFYNLSVANIKEIYNKLNAHFELWEGESDADPYIKPMLEYLKTNKFTEISEGAEVITVKENSDTKEIPPLILIKSDGGLLYDSTELATLYSRVKRYDLAKMVYLTDLRQELHFIQTFRAAYKTKIVKPSTELIHLGFGTINGPDGKPFKTRDGNIMTLTAFIELIKKETIKLIKDNIPDSEKPQLAENLAIAAIKYADLLPNRTSDYIFDPVKFSDLNGKTGPYLLYNTVRMKSLLEKCKENNLNPSKYLKIYNEEERNIILNIIKIKNIIKDSYESNSVSELADFVYKLINSFNAFYNAHEVLSEKDEQKKESYVTLINLVYEITKTLINILGLKIPDKI